MDENNRLNNLIHKVELSKQGIEGSEIGELKKFIELKNNECLTLQHNSAI